MPNHRHHPEAALSRRPPEPRQVPLGFEADGARRARPGSGSVFTLIRAAEGRRAGCQDLTNAPWPVPLFSARVQVSLRPSVLDPAGEATRAAAGRLGVDGVRRLRIGKAIDVELEAADAETARAQLELLSDRLLANPVIEDWTLDLHEAG
jgi:phosphoribosylformylglycinamidine synthase PurS subunit